MCPTNLLKQFSTESVELTKLPSHVQTLFAPTSNTTFSMPDSGINDALMALDPIMIDILKHENLTAFPTDTEIFVYLKRDDLQEAMRFLEKIIAEVNSDK